MIDKIHNFLMRPWLLAGIATVVLTGPVSAQDWTHDPADTSGVYGPNAWSDAFPCAGLTQSPVDIATAVPQAGPALEFDYKDTSLVVANDGHLIEVPYGVGSELRVGTEVYQLERIQFHTMSEHTYLGQQYDMEAHLVHRNTLGEVAIVAVFLQGNTSQNGFVDQALANAPQVVSTNQTAVTVNALDLIPTNTAAFFASSADTPIEYTPVAYSPIADTAMAYTPVHWGDKEKWKATWKEWKQALRDLFDRNRAQEREREKRRAMVKARKAAKAALKAAAKAERKAAKAERKAARKAAKAERKAARKDDDGTSGDTGTPPGDTGTPPGDTGTPPGDTGTPPVATALQVDTYFEYMGSLTMPMCPNNTRWFVLPAVVNVSSNSVATMQQLVAAFPNYDGYPYNYRPTQPLFGRTIKQIQP